MNVNRKVLESTSPDDRLYLNVALIPEEFFDPDTYAETFARGEGELVDKARNCATGFQSPLVSVSSVFPPFTSRDGSRGVAGP